MSGGRDQQLRGFRRLDTLKSAVELTVDGRVVTAAPSETVAALLLSLGIDKFQSNKSSGDSRGPYCMMGVCFECLVTVDDVRDVQACMQTVRAGMRVKTQLVQKAFVKTQ